MHSLSDATLQRLAATLREPLGFDRAKAEWLAERLLQESEEGVLVAPNVLLDAYSRAKVRSGARIAGILQAAAECLVGHRGVLTACCRVGANAVVLICGRLRCAI